MLLAWWIFTFLARALFWWLVQGRFGFSIDLCGRGGPPVEHSLELSSKSEMGVVKIALFSCARVTNPRAIPTRLCILRPDVCVMLLTLLVSPLQHLRVLTLFPSHNLEPNGNT